MKYFARDASIVVATLLALFLVMAAMGKSLPIEAVLLGGSVGLVTAAARAWRRVLEERAAANKRPRQKR